VAIMKANGSTLWRRARADGSYASANDPRVLAGLGDSAQPPRVRVVWPDGRVEEFDGLAIDRAHVVGVSLGGMVGQHLAIEHAPRLRSLTAIMSSPGARRFLPQPRALRAMFAPAPKTAVEAGRHLERVFATIGSTAWSADGARVRALGEAVHARGFNARGFLRQLAAVVASGDRRARLGAVHVPTLVMHGTRDPLIPMAAGRMLARLVPDATWLPITGMGHDLPSQLWPMFVAAITRHAERAERR